MKKTFFALAALLLALCLLLSACGKNPGALTEREREAAMEAERLAQQALSEAAAADAAQAQEPVSRIWEELVVSAADPERLLYRDDTLIVYTVETPADCSEVIMSLLYRDYSLRLQMTSYTEQERRDFKKYDSEVLWAYNSPLKQLHFTPESEGVTVEEKDGALLWTIPCDFGFTGAERVAAEAVCPGDDTMHIFGVTQVDIRYPAYNVVDEVETAIRAAVELNRDEPLYFVCDLSETSLDFENLDPSLYTSATMFGLQRTVWGSAEEMRDVESKLGTEFGVYWDYVQKDPEVYGGSLYTRLPYYAQIASSPCTNTEAGTDRIPLSGLYVPEGEGVQLCGIRLGNEDLLLPEQSPDWLNFAIDPGTRAIICYQAGIDADPESFPSAAVTQAGAEAVLAQCIKPGMTEFEKAKAILDWMYNRGKEGQLPSGFSSFSKSKQQLYYKRAYGFMTDGFGDCMGWSGTFAMLCRMAGLRCYYMECAATPGGSTLEKFQVDHRLNALYLDGEMYFVDSYWCAAGSSFMSMPYSFFLLTTAQAAEYYTWDGHLNIPETTATRYAVDPETGELLN